MIKKLSHVREFFTAVQHITKQIEMQECSIILNQVRIDVLVKKLNEAVQELSTSLIAQKILEKKLPIKYSMGNAELYTFYDGPYSEMLECSNNSQYDYIQCMTPELKNTGEMLVETVRSYNLKMSVAVDILTVDEYGELAFYLTSPISGERELAKEMLKKFNK